jgi:hypothetical protein
MTTAHRACRIAAPAAPDAMRPRSDGETRIGRRGPQLNTYGQ